MKRLLILLGLVPLSTSIFYSRRTTLPFLEEWKIGIHRFPGNGTNSTCVFLGGEFFQRTCGRGDQGSMGLY